MSYRIYFSFDGLAVANEKGTIRIVSNDEKYRVCANVDGKGYCFYPNFRSIVYRETRGREDFHEQGACFRYSSAKNCHYIICNSVVIDYMTDFGGIRETVSFR